MSVNYITFMQICNQEFTKATLLYIESLLAKDPGISRGELSRQICHHLGWRGLDGRFKVASCRIALNRLEERCIINLPPTKAAYRFFENTRTSLPTILPSHYEATMQRASKESVILAVQDTTSLTYTNSSEGGFGPISHSANKSLGVLVHDTMAFNEHGTPLGLLDVQYWARDPKKYGDSKKRKKLPIEQKESKRLERQNCQYDIVP